MSVRRFLGQLPPQMVIGIVGAILIIVICLASFALVNGAAPGAEDRFYLVVACLLLLQRLLKNNSLQPGTKKRTIDACVSLALGGCVLWYVRTGSPSPLHLSGVHWFIVAWMIGWALGALIEHAHQPPVRATD